MIHNVETISIGGMSKLKIFGLDYEAQSVNSPAELNATFVDENNALTEPSLSYVTPTTIKVGGITLKMFPIFYDRAYSSTGENLLKVKYVDGSFILDQYFVGLKSKHHEYTGPSQKNSGYASLLGGLDFNSQPTEPVGKVPSNLILLGDFIDPCRDFSKKNSFRPM